MVPPERSPVLAGVAQVEQRVFDPAAGKEPLDLMVEAVREATRDAGAKSLLQAATSVRVIFGMWPYQNPARLVADRLGISSVETVLTPIGGNRVQTVVNQTALDICRGHHDVVIITGAECGNSQAKARKAGIKLNWSTAPGTPDRTIGNPTPYLGDAEAARGMNRALQFYAVFENALRHQRGDSVPKHQLRISELWEKFSRVAVNNPHAWLRSPITAESYTVVYGDDGPQVGHVACLTPDGRRTWANATNKQVLSAMTQEEFCGKSARIDGEGNIEFL